MMRPQMKWWLLVPVVAGLMGGCTLSKTSETQRDPYSMETSSDPGISAGNPY